MKYTINEYVEYSRAERMHISHSFIDTADVSRKEK